MAQKTKQNKTVKVAAANISFTASKTNVVSPRPKIGSTQAYDITMREIDSLMKKGEANLKPAELSRLRAMAEAAEKYEDTHEPLHAPASLPEMIRVKLFQMRIKQNYAAKLLGISDTKFSMIMNGKQKPDIYFVKAIHDKLKMDANLILQAIA